MSTNNISALKNIDNVQKQTYFFRLPDHSFNENYETISRLYILIPLNIQAYVLSCIIQIRQKLRSTHQAFSSHCALPPFCPKDARAFALALLALLLGRPERVRRGRRRPPGRAGKRQESKRGSVGELELNPT